MAEIQQQLPHSTQHMNTGDVIQIEALDFDPDIDEALPIPVDQNTDHEEIQGSANSTQQFSKKTATTGTPASLQQDAQDVDWLDASQWKYHHSLNRTSNKIHLQCLHDMRQTR